MTDIYSKDKRSAIMSRITGFETKPEIIVRQHLFSLGFRFKKNVKELPGKPDIVLPKYNIVIFVHGCFWHGHNCKAGKLPETRKNWWANKIKETRKRDKKNIEILKSLGWNSIVIWECEIKTRKTRGNRMSSLIKEIKKLN